MLSDETSKAAGAALGFFLKAVGYPDRPPAGVSSHVLSVDGMEIRAEEADGRIVLSYVLADSDAGIPRLVEYAAGRMLKADAVLSFGKPGFSVSDSSESAFLWQDAPAGADARAFRRLFESFLDSCEWWRARVDALRGGDNAATGLDAMVILP